MVYTIYGDLGDVLLLFYPHYSFIPVVPHKAVAEVSKIGNL